MATLPATVPTQSDLEAARERFRRRPSEANAQECERIFKALRPDLWLDGWSERANG